ncbi:MAG: hypothetical protein K1X57_22225 [Gemmataceae bacterium]|nr:hypothetical protein [Gemmataceae bacterium]
MCNDHLKATDLQLLVDKLSTEERLRLASYALRVAYQIRVQGPSEAANASTPPGRTGRRPGLHSGAATTRDDFDAPLPEDG